MKKKKMCVVYQNEESILKIFKFKYLGKLEKGIEIHLGYHSGNECQKFCEAAPLTLLPLVGIIQRWSLTFAQQLVVYKPCCHWWASYRGSVQPWLAVTGGHHIKCLLKGTGTRDLIWLKVVSLDRSWLVGLRDDL